MYKNFANCGQTYPRSRVHIRCCNTSNLMGTKSRFHNSFPVPLGTLLAAGKLDIQVPMINGTANAQRYANIFLKIRREQHSPVIVHSGNYKVFLFETNDLPNTRISVQEYYNPILRSRLCCIKKPWPI